MLLEQPSRAAISSLFLPSPRKATRWRGYFHSRLGGQELVLRLILVQLIGLVNTGNCTVQHFVRVLVSWNLFPKMGLNLLDLGRQFDKSNGDHELLAYCS